MHRPGEFPGIQPLLLLSVLLCCILPFPQTGQAAEEEVVLQLKGSAQFQYAGYYAALEKGFYQNAGLKVTIKEGKPVDAVKAVTNHTAQFGVSSTNLLYHQDQGQQLVVLASVFQHAPSLLISQYHQEGTSSYTLIERKLELSSKHLEQHDVIRLLMQQEVLPQQLHFVEVGWNLQNNKDATSQFSAYIDGSLNNLEYQGILYNIISLDSYGINFYGDVIFTTKERLRQQRDQVSRFRDASLKGWKYALNHHEEIIQKLLSYDSVQRRGITRLNLHGESIFIKSLIMPDLIELGHNNPERWQDIVDIYASMRLLSKDFTLEGFLYDPDRDVFHWNHWTIQLLLAIMTAIGGTALVLLLFNRQLKREVFARTRRVQEMHNELQISEEKYRLLFAESQDAISILDVDTLQILEVNDSHLQLYGYSREEILKMKVTDLSAEAEKTHKAIETAAKHGGFHIPLRWHQRKDGSIFPVEVSVGTFVWNQRKVVCTIIRDVTNRLRYEEEMLKAKEEAETSSHLKTQFLSHLSHEIRTPMNVILGTTQLLAATPMASQQQEYTRRIINSGQHLLNIMQNILDLSKIEAGITQLKLAPFDLVNCVEDILDMLRVQAAEKQLELCARFDPNLPRYIVGDITRLRQMLVNLINNAIKFSDQGVIAVAVVLLGSHENEVELQFSVSDQGIGIHADKIALIFKPFVQVSDSPARNESGAGLGLSITANLAKLMGGQIWVESEAGHGSIFFFTIKALLSAKENIVPPDPQTAFFAATAVNTTFASQYPLSILVAEDYEPNRFLMFQFLKSLGYDQVGFVETGEAALEALNMTSYDLILMDVQMPVMDGLEATQRIRELHPQGKPPFIIAMTAFAIHDQQYEWESAGMDDYILKPLSLETLRRTLEKYGKLCPTHEKSR